MRCERLAEVAALSSASRAKRHAGDRQPVRDDDVGPAARTSSSTRCRAATRCRRSTPRRRGHATRAVPRGRAPRATTSSSAFGGDGTVNEAANGLAGSDTPLTCLPGGATNVYAGCSGSPTTSSTPPSTCSGWPTHWAPRAVDLGRVNGRCFTFSAGIGLDASVVERVDAHPHAEGALRAVVLRRGGGRDVPRRYVVSPPRLDVEVDGARRCAGVSAFVQNGERLHVLPSARGRSRAAARSGALPGSCSPGATLRRATVTFARASAGSPSTTGSRRSAASDACAPRRRRSRAGRRRLPRRRARAASPSRRAAAVVA